MSILRSAALTVALAGAFVTAEMVTLKPGTGHTVWPLLTCVVKPWGRIRPGTERG